MDQGRHQRAQTEDGTSTIATIAVSSWVSYKGLCKVAVKQLSDQFIFAIDRTRKCEEFWPTDNQRQLVVESNKRRRPSIPVLKQAADEPVEPEVAEIEPAAQVDNLRGADHPLRRGWSRRCLIRTKQQRTAANLTTQRTQPVPCGKLISHFSKYSRRKALMLLSNHAGGAF